MRKPLVYLLLVFVAILSKSSYSQSREPISYLIPDTVKNQISNYIKGGLDKHYYGVLQHQNDTTSIIISTYDKSLKELSYLIDNTNRCIKLNNKTTIPLLLTSDLILSEHLHIIKNKGESDEIMSVAAIHISGYLVIYKGIYWNVSLIKAEYYRN